MGKAHFLIRQQKYVAFADAARDGVFSSIALSESGRYMAANFSSESGGVLVFDLSGDKITPVAKIDVNLAEGSLLAFEAGSECTVLTGSYNLAKVYRLEIPSCTP